MLSAELLKHNGKWVIVHYMVFVFIMKYGYPKRECRVGTIEEEETG